MVSAQDVVAASVVVLILPGQLSQELEASAPTSESSSFRRLCSFILIIRLSSHQYSAAKRIYKPINPGGRALRQPNIVLHVPSRAGREEPRVPRGTFIISPFAVKCAMSVEHSLVIFLLYSTMHWPFCKIMVLSPYQLICCQSVTYLNGFQHQDIVQVLVRPWLCWRRAVWAVLQLTGFWVPLVYMRKMGAKPRLLFSGRGNIWNCVCVPFVPRENAPLNSWKNLDACVHLEVWLVCIFKTCAFCLFYVWGMILPGKGAWYNIIRCV